ncbi:DUF2157 domain-containing protein [Dyadobacter frigoris]|uniref:DUF2157 domain-containing protein n=1 Tax=Dyadobacter frigoris TaxID=2576211 RepID=A0A4U6D0T9_9BACT|nr:DUF2157 domain-containing protein [Dyadobacter frigoris]TKT90206.1 DUF2157 domain-containing protein [Dyadobacter frigoris]GLU52439.1 hypothetical protein Dfri01_19000 [Dyadobacter frigoris]
MTTKSILESFTQKGILPEEQAVLITEYERTKSFSIHRELRAILYLGITLLTTGLGILIYKNIDTIGHQAIIALIAASIIACFYHLFKNRQPFSRGMVINTDQFSEYILILACTLFLTLEGYLQYQYQFFGTRYGIAIFIPTVLFFFLAYRFDNKAVLSMGITGLASWLGLTISPLSVLEKNDFTAPGIIITGIVLGIALVVISWLSEKNDIKSHFGFTYMLLGGNLAAISGLAGLFNNDPKIIYFLITAALCTFLIQNARKTQSLIFLLMGVIYGYIAVTYAAFVFLPDSVLAALSIFYFLFTSLGVLFFLLNVKKILGLKK